VLFKNFGNVKIDVAAACISPVVTGSHLLTLLFAMSLDVPERRGHYLNPCGFYEINAAAEQHIEIARDHGAAVTAQQHRGAIAQGRSDFVPENVSADQ
jgi:hypothetical protein